MMDGRTNVTSRFSRDSRSARSPRAFVYAYTSGQPSDCARALPCSTSRLRTQSSRRRSLRSASNGLPAAPSARRARLAKVVSRSDWRLSFSASASARRPAVTSARQLTSGEYQVSVMSSSNASPRRFPATYAVLTAMRCPPDPALRMAAATRDGPSRLTSTARSSGESKLTVAAECTTVLHVASTARPASSRPSSSEPTSPAMA